MQQTGGKRRSDQNDVVGGNGPDITGPLLIRKDILTKSIERLRKSVEALEAEFAERLNSVKAEKRAAEETLRHIDALLRTDGWTPDGGEGSEASGGVDGTFIERAFDYLKGTHKPLHYKKLAEELGRQRIHIPGREAAATLLSKMHRDNRFKRFGRGIYGLSGWRRVRSRPKGVKRGGRKSKIA